MKTAMLTCKHGAYSDESEIGTKSESIGAIRGHRHVRREGREMKRGQSMLASRNVLVILRHRLSGGQSGPLATERRHALTESLGRENQVNAKNTRTRHTRTR